MQTKRSSVLLFTLALTVLGCRAQDAVPPSEDEVVLKVPGMT